MYWSDTQCGGMVVLIICRRYPIYISLLEVIRKDLSEPKKRTTWQPLVLSGTGLGLLSYDV